MSGVDRPLDALFSSSRARVLDVLLSVQGRFTARHVGELAGVSPPTASQALKALEATGVVTREDIGRAHVYALNRDHYLVPALQGLVQEAGRDEEIILEAMRSVAPVGAQPNSIIVFGSVARGEEAAESDLDILIVVGRAENLAAWRDERPVVEDRLSRTLGRRVELALATPPDPAEADNPFWQNVRKDGRVLSGASIEQVVGGK